MTTPAPSPKLDALQLCRDALRVARVHLVSHGGYNLRIASIIEKAEREADRALEAKVVA